MVTEAPPAAASETLVWLRGEVVPAAHARISVFDRGFLYGDSVYETVGTIKGRLFALPEHLTRLERSASRIGIVPPPRATVERAVRATLAAAGHGETRVRIVITRGSGPLDLDPASAGEPELLVIAAPLGAPSGAMHDQGVAVAVVGVTRNHPRAIDPAVKSGNYLNNVLAVAEARRQGAYEAILCAADGSLAEGASSNVFVVKDGALATPPLAAGLLDGITRGFVLRLAREAGLEVKETRLLPDDLRRADEAFITSATRGVLPVTRVDGHAVGAGRPGPITRRLGVLYDALAEREAR